MSAKSDADLQALIVQIKTRPEDAHLYNSRVEKQKRIDAYNQKIDLQLIDKLKEMGLCVVQLPYSSSFVIAGSVALLKSAIDSTDLLNANETLTVWANEFVAYLPFID